jgi:hypothetical protein
MANDLPPLVRSTAGMPERTPRRQKGSKFRLIADTADHLLALPVTPARTDICAEIGVLARAVLAFAV